jgi:hypothetical protein
MVVYSMLEMDKVKITSSCPNLISAIPSRIHDDSNDGKRQEDVKKTSDVLDDCFIAGTMIMCENGVEKPIESLNIGDKVLTRAGLKKITRCIKRRNYVTLCTGSVNLTGTGEHKIWTTRGLKSLKDIQGQDVLKLFYTKELNTDDTLMQNNKIIEDTFPVAQTKDEMKVCSIGKFGLMPIIDRLRKNIIFITKTTTTATITLKTWAKFLGENISLSIYEKGLKIQKNLLSYVNMLLQFVLSQRLGILQMRAENGMLLTADQLILMQLDKKEIVNSVQNCTKLSNKIDFVRQRARLHTGGKSMLTMLKSFVVGVKNLLLPTSITRLKIVPSNVQLSKGGIQDVYDLTVEDVHEFFANGVLVSNCYDSCRYLLYSHTVTEVKKPRHLIMEESITSKDPTIAMIQRKVIEARFGKEDEPVSYASGREWRRGSC